MASIAGALPVLCPGIQHPKIDPKSTPSSQFSRPSSTIFVAAGTAEIASSSPMPNLCTKILDVGNAIWYTQTSARIVPSSLTITKYLAHWIWLASTKPNADSLTVRCLCTSARRSRAIKPRLLLLCLILTGRNYRCCFCSQAQLDNSSVVKPNKVAKMSQAIAASGGDTTGELVDGGGLSVANPPEPTTPSAAVTDFQGSFNHRCRDYPPGGMYRLNL